MLSLPLARAPESQLAAVNRKTLDFTKEDTPHPRTEEKPQ